MRSSAVSVAIEPLGLMHNLRYLSDGAEYECRTQIGNPSLLPAELREVRLDSDWAVLDIAFPDS